MPLGYAEIHGRVSYQGEFGPGADYVAVFNGESVLLLVDCGGRKHHGVDSLKEPVRKVEVRIRFDELRR